MIFRWIIFIFGLGALLGSCVTSEGGAGFSERVLTIASIDLFSQQEQPRNGRSWAGDWQFRRDRLDLIDATFRDVRPDIIVMQNAMRRAGSVSESDELILKSGALNRYDWKDFTVETLSESGEDRLLAVAVSKPLFHQKLSENARNYTRFGVDGHMIYLPVNVDGSPVIVFNVQMPSKIDQSGLWYSLIEERIKEAVQEFHSCIERVIVAGYLPFEQQSRRFKDFLTGLRLKDTGSGYCQSAERCNTASPQNGIFLATRGDESASQVDRVMTNEWSIVYGAGANFTRTMETSDYFDSYGLSRVWPSQRYGWVSRVRIPNCPRK
jgi:hypothetical protein